MRELLRTSINFHLFALFCAIVPARSPLPLAQYFGRIGQMEADPYENIQKAPSSLLSFSTSIVLK